MDILVKDLKVFAAFNEDLFKEITQLLTLENFRQVHFYFCLCSVMLTFYVYDIQITGIVYYCGNWTLLFYFNCRDNEQLSKYGDTQSARGIMLAELKKLIEANPLFRDKLQFPTLKNSRLRTLINQRFFWNP